MFGKKKDNKRSLEEMLKESEGLVCESCRTPIPGNINLCPKCGLNPSVTTMQSVYKPGEAEGGGSGKEGD